MELERLVDEVTRRVAEQLALGGRKSLICEDTTLWSQLSPAYQLIPLEKSTEIEPYCAGMILERLPLELTGKLLGGCCDTPKSLAAAKMLLKGKPVWVVESGVELLEMAGESAYYRHLREKLDLLERFGLSIRPRDQIADSIMNEQSHPKGKKLITRADVKQAWEQGTSCVWVRTDGRVTPLARDEARRLGINLREEKGER